MYTIHRVGSKQIILRSLEAGNTSWALTLVRWRTFAEQTYQKSANYDKESGGGSRGPFHVLEGGGRGVY